MQFVHIQLIPLCVWFSAMYIRSRRRGAVLHCDWFMKVKDKKCGGKRVKDRWGVKIEYAFLRIIPSLSIICLIIDCLDTSELLIMMFHFEAWRKWRVSVILTEGSSVIWNKAMWVDFNQRQCIIFLWATEHFWKEKIVVLIEEWFCGCQNVILCNVAY